MSGGFYNPAVSLGVYLSDRSTLDVLNFLWYIVAEFVGGMLGSAMSTALINESSTFTPSPSFGVGVAFVFELFVSTMLCLMVQTAAIAGAFGPLAGAYIGLVVGVGIIVDGPITGACFNPAVSVGQSVAHAVQDPGSFKVDCFFLYTFTPFLGSFVSTLLFHTFYCELYVFLRKPSYKASKSGGGGGQEMLEDAPRDHASFSAGGGGEAASEKQLRPTRSQRMRESEMSPRQAADSRESSEGTASRHSDSRHNDSSVLRPSETEGKTKSDFFDRVSMDEGSGGRGGSRDGSGDV